MVALGVMLLGSLFLMGVTSYGLYLLGPRADLIILDILFLWLVLLFMDWIKDTPKEMDEYYAEKEVTNE